MKNLKYLALATIGVLAIAGCARQETAAQVQAKADAAAIKGDEAVANAQRNAASADIKADAAVTKTEDKADTQVNNAEVDAAQKSDEDQVHVALVRAKADYNVEVAKCGALTGADRSNCKNGAQANLDNAEAAAKVLRQASKADAKAAKD